MGRVGVVHQDSAVERVRANGFGEDRVLHRDVVGVGDLDRLVDGVADGYVIHDRVAGVAQAQSVIGRASGTRPDADVLQDPVLGEICRSLNGLVLIRTFVSDKPADGDTARRGLPGDGHIAVGQVDLGVDQTADLEQDVLRAGLVDGPLQGASAVGVEVGDVDNAATAAAGGVGAEPFGSGERREWG